MNPDALALSVSTQSLHDTPVDASPAGYGGRYVGLHSGPHCGANRRPSTRSGAAVLLFNSAHNKNATVGTPTIKPRCHCGHLFADHLAWGCQWCGCKEAR